MNNGRFRDDNERAGRLDTKQTANGQQANERHAHRPRHGALRLAWSYFRFNLSASMAYSTSFLIQVFGMALNNSAFIIFWIVLFQRVGGDIAGYSFNGVMYLWAMVASGFGLGVVLFGNAPFVSRMIYNGELDVYLLQPRAVLPNLLMSRSIVSGWGDFGYGIALFLITQPIDPRHTALFVVSVLLMAIVFTSVRVFYHSLTFFLGNAEGFAQLAGELLINFMLYPGSIFQGPVRWLLHSLLPVAFIAYIPAELFMHFSSRSFALLLGADVVIVAVSIWFFHLGLRRYESGNLIGARM